VETSATFARELTVRADHGQIYIYSLAATNNDDAWETSENVYLDALEDATSSRRFVGVAGGLVDLMTPGQWNWETPMRVEVWNGEPAADAGWDHEVDVDLDIPDGQLHFDASGGSGSVRVEVPAGMYRARVAGRGFTALGVSGDNATDEYRLRLWPRTVDSDPKLRIAWPGWADYR